MQFDKMLARPVTMAAKRIKDKINQHAHEMDMRRAHAENNGIDLKSKAAKIKDRAPAHDALVAGTHQQIVHQATATTRSARVTAASHVQAAMRAPSPGLQLASVRVAPVAGVTSPKTSSFAWKAPKFSK